MDDKPLLRYTDRMSRDLSLLLETDPDSQPLVSLLLRITNTCPLDFCAWRLVGLSGISRRSVCNADLKYFGLHAALVG
jgi:hypothetical protein